MKPDESPFKTGWYSQNLKGYRDDEEDDTYVYYSYESLPPLSEELFKGDFSWLSDQDIVQPYKDAEFSPDRIGSLVQQAEALGCALPKEFINFFSANLMPSKIRSCTDCRFDLPGMIQPCSDDPGGYVVSFLADSQGCLFWNLYISPTGDSCVVASYDWYDKSEDYMDEDEEDEDEVMAPKAIDLLYCAPSFEEFVYRFWIENDIWFTLYRGKGTPLTNLQLKYLSHYKPS
jgi:hypothetical protein